MKVFGIVGWKNSGKTTLTERLISNICERGYSVSTIKHAHHSFEVDQEGKDSFRHRVSGARQVLVSSRNRWALISELREETEPDLSALISTLSEVDLVLIEGYKNENHPKIEVHRDEINGPLLAESDETIIAIASDSKSLKVTTPVTNLNDIDSIARLILKRVDLL